MDDSRSSIDLRTPLGPLRLEQRKGFTDEAVSGGLGSFMERWCAARAEVSEEAEREDLESLRELFLGYARLDPAERAARVAQALPILERLPPAPASRPPKPQRRQRQVPVSPHVAQDLLRQPVTVLAGVADKRAELLGNLGIETVEDLLRHYPLRYEDRRTLSKVTELRHRQQAAVYGEIVGPGQSRRVRGRVITEVLLRDATGVIALTWFNQKWREEQFNPGEKVIASGTVKVFAGRATLQTPECERVSGEASLDLQRIVPIYPLTKGLYQPQLRRLIRAALQRFGRYVVDCLPAEVRAERGLPEAAEALAQVHFPDSFEQLELARKRLAFEELFLLQIELARSRTGIKRGPPGIAFDVPSGLLEEFTAALPFELTGAQRRVIREVQADLVKPEPANRLIHGEVGAGKTVVAAFAMFVAGRNGYQSAVMVPTEILAEQHHRVLSELLGPLGFEPVLLIGSLKGAEKRQQQERIARGEALVVVGTHALIQEAVSFQRLGVVVVDEQHRFGVLQRAELRQKGTNPDVFVMTATPIPRTLALTVYGDFDISQLDELPPGRQPCRTDILTMRQRPKAYEAVRAEVAAGRQAYIVCPLVEESDSLELQAATALAERLQQEVFPELRLALLHGRLTADQRSAVMEAFRSGQVDVLVSTTVVEVGVDVPNATLMLVENAERFGLSQLHQLRGRVRRGHHPARCLLLVGSRSEDAWERMKVLDRTEDGFEVAEEDLRLRGPGEFYGTRQHGLPDLKMADVIGDTAALIDARKLAFDLVEQDPDLAAPECRLLREAVERQIAGRAKLMDVT